MPIYEYQCQTCHAEFELLVSSSTKPACPECGKTELARQVSLVAPQGTSKQAVATGRRAAAAEGHFSNYSAAERSKIH